LGGCFHFDATGRHHSSLVIKQLLGGRARAALAGCHCLGNGEAQCVHGIGMIALLSFAAQQSTSFFNAGISSCCHHHHHESLPSG
jgi:hypothetical protein